MTQSRFLLILLLVLWLLPSCRKQAPTPQAQRMDASERALARPETQTEAAMQCISIERALDMAEMVQTNGQTITGLRAADRIDAMMRTMGYAKSPVAEIYQQGRAIIYTQGCEADDMGSMKNVESERATLVTIASVGQPQTAPLVIISMTSEQVFKQLRREMAEQGFGGHDSGLTNGTGYKILVDHFLSGTGYVVQISRE